MNLIALLSDNTVKTPCFSPLSSQDETLYHEIVNDIIRLHIEQRTKQSSSENRVLIFRESQSWKTAEGLLGNIQSTDKKIQKWVKDWLNRIQAMRDSRGKIQDHSSSIKQLTSELELCKEDSSKNEKQNEINLLKGRIGYHKNLICCKLKEGRENLDALESMITASDSRQEVISFLNTYWLHLQVFSEWPEVSLDEAKISVQLKRRKSDFIPFQELINPSTKAIFTINSSIKKTNECGKTISTAEVQIENQFFDKTEPPKKNGSSITIVQDTFLYNLDFSQPGESLATLEKHNANAERFERIVTMALNRVNVIINSKDPNTTDWSSLKFSKAELNDPQADEEQTPYLFQRVAIFLNSLFLDNAKNIS